jgi:hypothetical protein
VNFVYRLQGWLATTPLYGHTLALSNLMLAAFMKVGDIARPSAFARRLALNGLLASCILLLLLLIVLAAPFYNAGMLIGSFLLTGVMFESEAFVDAGAVLTLVPVQRSQIMFEKGAAHVRARSSATSALLLPV